MNRRQDLPLRNDIAARFVPKIVALMVYLGTLCLIFTLFLIHSTDSWKAQFTTHLSVEIPTFPGSSSSLHHASVIQLLNQTPGIQHATAVPQKEMINLFYTLLGKEANLELFSFPIIIDVVLNKKEIVDISALETHLKNISPDIQLMDHRAWQAQVSNLIHTSILIALMVTFLILFAALATTTFATRTSLLIHRQVIEVLSLMGATPSYIAKQFQMNALKQGLMASVIGSSFAFLTFLGIGTLLKKAGFPFAVNSSFFSQTLCIFTLAPFFTAFSMMLSARLAVMKALRR